MVEFKDVSVTYSSGVDALNKVNLKINDGDFAFVVLIIFIMQNYF